jgi:hypothetical protein
MIHSYCKVRSFALPRCECRNDFCTRQRSEIRSQRRLWRWPPV